MVFVIVVVLVLDKLKTKQKKTFCTYQQLKLAKQVLLVTTPHLSCLQTISTTTSAKQHGPSKEFVIFLLLPFSFLDFHFYSYFIQRHILPLMIFVGLQFVCCLNVSRGTPLFCSRSSFFFLVFGCYYNDIMGCHSGLNQVLRAHSLT